jgi:hypothetical protein
MNGGRFVRKTAELLQDARLYVLLDGRASPDSFAQLVQALVEAGVDVLQLRDKRLPDRDLVERARVLRQRTQGTARCSLSTTGPTLPCCPMRTACMSGRTN